MSQQYPPGGGPPPGQQPPYGQPQQPQQQPPYGQQPPPYGQPPQQYGQQPAPYGYQQPYAPAPVPAPVVEADAYERSLSLMAYVWVAIGALIGGNVLELRNVGRISFFINIAALAILLLPLAAQAAAGDSQLVRFHAKQAFLLGVAYLVLRFAVGLVFIVDNADVQLILGGILVGAVQLLFVYLALMAGVRAFFRRELYRAPMVGGMVR